MEKAAPDAVDGTAFHQICFCSQSIDSNRAAYPMRRNASVAISHVDPGGNAVIVQINIGRIGIASHNDLAEDRCPLRPFPPQEVRLPTAAGCRQQCSRAEMHGVRFCASFGLFVLLSWFASAAQLCCCNSSFRSAWISVRHCSSSGLNRSTLTVQDHLHGFSWEKAFL